MHTALWVIQIILGVKLLSVSIHMVSVSPSQRCRNPFEGWEGWQNPSTMGLPSAHLLER
jgi:hypothetical protein